MRSSPSEISSRPATMRSAVVFPHPDGPTRTRNSPSLMSSERSCTAWKPLSYTLSTSLKTTSAIDPPDVEGGAVRRQDAVARVLAVQRLELRVRGNDRIVRRSRRETEKALGTRLAQVRNRIVRDVEVADTAVRERMARAAEPRECGHGAEKVGVPLVAVIPRDRAASVLAPLPGEADLVAHPEHRHAGARELEPETDEVTIAGAGDPAEPRCVVAVEERPRVRDRVPRDAAAIRAHDAHHLAAVVGRRRRDREDILADVVTAKPPGHRPQEAGVVHHSVPAAPVEIWAEVVTVLADQERSCDDFARERSDVVIAVEVAVARDHVRDVDAPPVETGIEPAPKDAAHAVVEVLRAPVELRQRADIEPGCVPVRQRLVEVEELALPSPIAADRALEPLVRHADVVHGEV